MRVALTRGGLVSVAVLVVTTAMFAEDEIKLSLEPAEDLGLADRGGTSRGLAWGDYDGDSYPDLIVANTDGEQGTLPTP